MAELTIVSVTHQSRDFIVEALKTARESAETAGLDYEVIVIDNASTDGTVDTVRDACPWVQVVAGTDNVGFGRANNRAFEMATGQILLLLNPDATLDRDTIGRLVAFLHEHPDAAAVAPSLTGPGRSESAGMQPGLRSLAGHFLLLNRLLPLNRGGAWRGLLLRPHRGAQPSRVEWVSGAVMALNAAAVRGVGGFDPRIFLYAEDLDLCDRLRAAGHSVWLLPNATGHHLIAGSQGRRSTLWVDALHGYYRPRASRVRLALFDLIMVGGLVLRSILSLRTGSTEQRLHRDNMRAGARRAFQLFYGSLAGKA